MKSFIMLMLKRYYGLRPPIMAHNQAFVDGAKVFLYSH